jgi:hypothetical protein
MYWTLIDPVSESEVYRTVSIFVLWSFVHESDKHRRGYCKISPVSFRAFARIIFPCTKVVYSVTVVQYKNYSRGGVREWGDMTTINNYDYEVILSQLVP